MPRLQPKPSDTKAMMAAVLRRSGQFLEKDIARSLGVTVRTLELWRARTEESAVALRRRRERELEREAELLATHRNVE